MVQLINLGGLSTLNGKQVLNGSNSGLDTTSLVNELATAKAQPATNLQTKITNNTTKMAAFSQMQTLLTNMQTSMNALRNPPGLDASANVFAARTPFLTMSDGSTASNYVGVTTSNGAPIGNYNIEVDQLATAETDQSGSFSAASASAVGTGSGQFAAGNFSINGAPISLTAGESLTNVASAINAVSSQSNVTASIVKYSSTDTRLVLTAKKTGGDNAIVFAGDNGTSFQATLTNTQAAKDSSIKFNGQTVTRDNNTISDLLNGVTFTLYQPTPVDNSTNPATPITATLNIDKDDATIATAIGSFIDSYNAVRAFQASQNAHDPATGALLSSAVLANDPTLSTIIGKLATAINSQTSQAIPTLYGATTAAPTRIGDLGISLTDQAAVTGTTAADGTVTGGSPEVDNILTVNTSVLATALDSNFDAVQNVFQFGFSASSSDLSDYSRDNTVMNTKLTISPVFVSGSNNVNGAQTNQGPIGGPVGSTQYQITQIDGADLAEPITLTQSTDDNGNLVLTYDPVGDPSGDTQALEGLTFNYTDDGSGSMTKSLAPSAKAFGITVDPTQPAGSQALVTSILGHALNSPLVLTYTTNGSSGTIQGPAGSPFAGLKMIYTGSTTAGESINVSITQGLADSVYNDLNSILNGTGNKDGLITTATNNLTSTDKQLQTQITQINDQVTAYRTQLVSKFSKLEAAIGSANQLLTLLSAQQDARNNNS